MNLKDALEWLRHRFGVRCDADTDELSIHDLIRDAVGPPPDDVATLFNFPVTMQPCDRHGNAVGDPVEALTLSLASCVSCRHLVLADARLTLDPPRQVRRRIDPLIGRMLLECAGIETIDWLDFVPLSECSEDDSEHRCDGPSTPARRAVRAAIAQWIDDRADALKTHRLDLWCVDIAHPRMVIVRIGKAGSSRVFTVAFVLSQFEELDAEDLSFDARVGCEQTFQRAIGAI